MSLLRTILAKSNPEETLQNHTAEVLRVWAELRKRYKHVITDTSFWNDSFYAVAFHDFGKICSNFQDTITGKKAFNDDQRVRHEFFSGMFLFANNPDYYLTRPEALVAVFSHHKPFNENGFNKHISNNTSLLHIIDPTLIDEFLEFIKIKAEEYGVVAITINSRFKYYVTQNYMTLHVHYRKQFYEAIDSKIKVSQKNRLEYIKHKAILNICDWTASGHLLLEAGKKYDTKSLKEKIISKLIEDGKIDIGKAFEFRKFQQASLGKGNVISIAPTGSGKTEAALLWASDKEDWERVMYLLPTRVTSNAIYQRLKSYFGGDTVQLIHSSAKTYLKEQHDNCYDEKKYFRAKSFFKNINVCTVDQILTQGFNLGFWEVKTFHMLNARVVIDEIHLYSPYTLGLIISTIKYLKEHFSARFFVMTATMPQALLSLLTDAIGADASIIKDTELLASARNTFEVRGVTLDGLTDEILEHLVQNKQVLVVVNTVDKAIELYERLADSVEAMGCKVMCYHSRFTHIDRQLKEKEIFEMERSSNGGLLVATQVVEVSLDIDFDILFTENAPIDAIIQRAGRVNRKRAKKDTKVIVARHFDASKKVYDLPHVLENTYSEFEKTDGKRPTENELTFMVDAVYKNLNIKDDPNYIEGLNKHFEIQHKYNFIKDMTSDEKVFVREDLDTISVIPDCFYEKLHRCKDEDEFTRHELSVRRYWKLKAQSRQLNGYCFLGGSYSKETGFRLASKESTAFY